MIIGIGTDVIEVARIGKSMQRHGQHFLDRLFSEREQSYCLKYSASERHFAGRFAAKEAIAKALGVGVGTKIGWLDIEILNEEQGKPVVHLSDHAKTIFGACSIKVSISHNQETAIAFAVAESEAPAER